MKNKRHAVQEASLFIDDQAAGTVRCDGLWTMSCLEGLEEVLPNISWPAEEIRLDCGGISGMDTAGAWLLKRMIETLESSGAKISLSGLKQEYASLLKLVGQECFAEIPAKNRPPGFVEKVGRDFVVELTTLAGLLSFIGETSIALTRTLARPGKIRWRATAANIQTTGFSALPIIGLLSFLIGIVIAYQGGVQLDKYGANIFIVDLVSVSMVRELAPLMTAIMVAGRTSSAFTAQIGTMQTTEEIDAIRVLGLSVQEIIVLPKMVALVTVLPLLTVYASILGIGGGMVMAAATMDVSMGLFISRLQETLTVQSYLAGMVKTPIFAAIIASVGCYQGFLVSSSAESVGYRTTVSVVHSIFLVIIIDAVFSILFSWMGV